MVPAALVAGLMLMLASCTSTTSQTTSSPSPDVSPSPTPVASPTPGETPTPVESPAPTPSPAPATSPSPAALLITSVPFHVGEIGVAYASVALGASGGVPPYKWSIATGSLPPGLALSSAGNASGKPTATGSYSFVVRVDDSAGAAAGVSRTITVVPHLSASGVCTKECDVEQGCVTVCGKFGSQTGGLAPYRYKVSVGVLPSGMALSGLALAGAFPVASNCGECRPLWQFSVTLSDALGATDAVNAIFYVFPHISISGPGAICSGFGCTTQVFYTSYDGSTPTVAITNVVCDAVDPGCQDPTTISGFSATSSGGTFGTITITFPGGEWVGTFDITIADQSSCGPSAICLSNTVTQAANVNAG